MSSSPVWSEVRPATLTSLLRSRAAEHGERTAFVFLADGEAEGERLTWAGLDARARTIAAVLRESLAPGDRALLLYPPGLEFIAAFFGCLQAGVIAVPAYPPRMRDRSQVRLRAIARDAGPKAALTTGSILAAFSASASVPELAAVRWIATGDLEGLEGSAAEIPEPDPESVAFLQYTSGSTATPKGVMVTHANLLHNERMIGAAFRQDESSVVVGWLPLYHDMGLIGNVLQPLHAGGSCVLMAPVAFLQKPLRWLEAIHRFRGTTSGGPNFAYELCLRRITEDQKAGLDLSSWRVAYNGAEPVRAETLARFAAAFAPCGFRREAFYPCYGLAEATLFVSGGAAGTAPRVEPFEERPLVSCGHAWEGQRIAVVDPESGEELVAGAVGEIWVAGPSVARGYWRNPEATAHDFQARLATGEGPFLRTGDLGFLRDGELYVTGRIKDLVIIRGRNHYPQDIELTAERSHPDLRPGSGAAFSVEVGGEERLVVVQEVERRRREGFDEVMEAVRRAVAEEHEVQVHDVVLVRVGTVPKTSSGKIQRRASRSLYLAGELEVVGRSAVATEQATPEALPVPTPGSLTTVEWFLRERVAAAVGVPAAAIDPERPLTAYGLDSLAAIELKSFVETALGVALPLADLLEGAGTAELAAALLARTDTDQHGRTRTDKPGPWSSVVVRARPCSRSRLSHGERALWFLDRLAPEGGAYNVTVAARARGLDPVALRRALTALVLRHPALRSVFPMVDDEPVRRVLDHSEIDFAVEDAVSWSEARLAERLADEAYRPFDLGRGPLLRVRAFDRGDGEHALLLAVHHIAVDFASLAVVARDLAALLQQTELEPLPFGYADFVRWQDEMLAGPRGERLWEHWREALADLPDLDLPADRPRPPVQTYRGGARTLELPPDLADGIRALASGRGATLFMSLLAVFQAQLARYAGQEDFAVGSPAAGRPPELAGAVGYFVNPVALRADFADEPTFATLLDRTRRAVLASLEHGDFPFALLAERLRPARDPARTPLFQVMFLLQRTRPGDAAGIATFALGEAGGRLDLGPLELESLRLEERRAQFDLTLRVAEEGDGRLRRLRTVLEFNTDLFDAATAERMLGHFRMLLTGAVEHPDRRVARLPLLTSEEREQVLVAWNATGADHRQDALLHGLFEEQAARTPDAEALVAGSVRLTYAELNDRANELARRLRALGVGPETRVGVRLGRSADLVVSLLGVLKAGGAYVPLDPKYPEERLALMLADSGARVVIDHRTDLTDLTDRSDQPVLPGNLAYLIYTSGSTGRPKAVAIEHRSAALMVQWARGAFSPEELAGVLASTSVAFDLSVFEIFVPLAWGGRVILAENALELPRLPAAGEVTLVNTVPSALGELVREGGLPPSVRTVNLAGEPIPPSLAAAVHDLPGGVRLYNLYGPSEDTTYSTWTRIAPGADVTIGRPIAETRAYVLDTQGEPLPVGVPGELLLGGGGLARGYLGRPELTAERFVPDPFGPPGGRLYRTGDLVRWRADGDLEYLGRIDHQVKIRGFRVELGEVEAALAGHPAVREAAVLALPEPEGGRRLAAYVVADEPVETAALRSWLQERLPDAFVPTAWKMLPALPLSPNGKVDRKALVAIDPQLAPEAEVTAGDAEPRTPVESALAALVAEALGVARVGLYDDFFALGGHSLLAARVASQASRLFGVDLPVSALFQAPTVAALAGRIASAAGGAEVASPVVPVLRPHEGREDLPLSFAQQRLWFLDRLQPGGAAYNMPGAAELSGALDVEALAAALSEVVRRHEALRTRFVIQEGQPVQVIDLPVPVVPETVDLTGLPDVEREAEAEARMNAEASAPFDLSRSPLLRTTLLRLAPERHRLLLTLHHMVADGWSLGVLLGELAALYGRTASLAEPPVQYADWVVWQRRRLAGEVLDRQLAWWTGELAGAPTTLELPADRPRPAVRTQRGGMVRSMLPGTLADGVRALARQRAATPFMALLAAFQALLLRVTGQDDVLVGSAVAGRTRPEVEGLIGFFANTLVLRGALAGDPSFLEALEQARQRTTGAWAHQDLPVERLVEELQPGRELGLTPLFQVVFVLQSAPAALALPGLAVRRLPVASGTAKFDLTLELTEQEDGLAAAWELSRDLFDEPTVERLAGWFENLLTGAVEKPERRLSDLPLLGEAELRQLLVEQNPAPTTAPLDTPVHRLFEEQAARGPERIALVLGDRELTYGELNERADRLARRLVAEGVGPETLVGVLLERFFEMIEAFLAILKAGGAYVPLDPSWPSERLAGLIEEAGIRLVVDREFLAGSGREKMPGGAGGQLAYAMFTSGSTGRPKTVGVEHRSIVRLVRDTDFADFGPDQVLLQLAAPAFDAATLEIWGALLHGARLVLYPAATPSLDELGEVLAWHGVTTLWLTAGLFHQVVESRIGILRGVRQLLAGGDVLAPAAVNRVLAELPETRLINGYGPTENTTFTCCHTVAAPVPPGRSVPVGRPIAGTSVYVVDRSLRPVPALVPGELLAGGAGLARGYLGRPDLTAERFVPDPFGEPGARVYRTGDLVRRLPSAEIEFLGRLDRQVKIRGFRVEPGEIEAVLSSHPTVAQAAVLLREPEAGDRRLMAYVVPGGSGELPLAELRAWLGERLPAYLIPALIALPELPLTANGKVDRQALERIAPEPAPGTPERAALDAPRTPVEELLAGIWAEVLGVERVGVHDDFFQLGGHSLLATRAVSRIVDTLQVDLPLSSFFEAPTVAGLAERLFGAASRTEAPPLVPVPRNAPLPLSFAQQRLWFLDRLAPGGSAYNIAVAALLEGDLDVASLDRSLGEIVRRHEALRTVFVEIEERPVQVVQPWTPPALARLDLSGLPEPDRAAREEAVRDAARPFDLAAGPVVRFVLTALGPPLETRRHLLAATFHHIAADGWSLQVFLRELAELYGAFAAGRTPELPEPPVQYADFAVWQRQVLAGPALARPLAFWRWRLAGLEPVELPADGPRTPAATAPARTRLLDLPAELADRAAALAREAGLTPFMVLLAGVYTLLARLTGQLDLTVGAPVAARHRMEVEGLIGFFANTLPLRADLGGEPSFRELAARVRTVVLEAHAHGDVPFERLVEELQPDRAPGRNPLFDVVLAYLSAPAGWTDLPGLALTPVDLPGAEAKLDLTFTIHERGGAFSGMVEGRGDLFEEATLGRLAGWLGTLLAGALAAPVARLAELPLLTGDERAQVLAWSQTAPAGPPAGAFHELFAARARCDPDAPAVTFAGSTLSFGDLDARANRLAHHLRARGAGPETIVAFLLERSIEAVTVLLAILKSGAAYLPLDPAQPEERLSRMLADAGAVLRITREWIDAEAAAIAARPATDPAAAVAPEGLAYLIYTSGSTGMPKGVAVSHRAMVWFGEAIRRAVPELREERRLRLGLNASLVFDASVQQLVHLLHGHGLWLVPEEARRDAGRLADFFREGELDGIDCTPSQLELLLEAAEISGRPPRFVLAGGEAIAPPLWERLAAHPHIRFYNVYGPTEATIDATAGLVEGERPHLGHPLSGYRVHLLDAALHPVPVGVRGEIWIGGPGLARGYWRQPGLTAERFRPDPAEPGVRLYRTGDLGSWRPDGTIQYHGRGDQQVKIRGFRIEPGEIEAVLREHPAVREAVVAAVPDPAGGSRLAAWVVAAAGEAPAPAELRTFLAGRLPAWMVPASCALLPALPLTPQGKVDRRALPRPSVTTVEEGWTAPRNALEEALAGVWSQVLGAERVGAHDDFFHLGGHSLLATQLAARVRAVFGVELPLSELFAAPTLAGMAERVEAARSTGEMAPPPLVRRLHPGAEAPLSFAQQRLWFLHQLEPDSPAYHVSGALRLSGPLRAEVLERALGAIVRRHEALRTVFPETDAGPVQRILPDLPVRLPALDLRGLASPAAEAERLGLAEARRLFDLAAGPVLRAQLLRLADDEHLLVVVLHHIASDGWSLGVMIRELAALYTALSEGTAGEPSPLPELPVQYADFAEWQRRTLRGRFLERQLGWWRAQLADPPVLDLPGDLPRPPVPSGRGHSLPVALPEGMARDLQALARREGVTLYMILLAAFATLLGRWSGQDDLTVGSPIANRDRQEIEPLIGCFVNTLTLRVRLAGDPGFRELLARVREVTLGAYDHQGVPFERLVEELAPERDRAHAPLFQVMLVLQNAPLPPLRVGPLVLERRELPTGTAKFDLTLALAEEEGGIAGTLEHSADLFETATAVRLMGHLAELLRGAADDPGRALADLPLLTAGERDQILGAWNDTEVVFEGAETLGLSDLVAAQAARTPRAQAVVGWRLSGEERLTYAELLARADRLAGHLMALGVGPEARVGVCLDRTADLPVALLAVLRAGGSYVPLDPAYPRERLEFMLRDSGAGVLVTQSDLAGRCGPFAGGTVFFDQTDRPDPSDRSDHIDTSRVLPRSLAYLIYTSGSTGLPKAVAIEHRSAVAMVLWALGAFSAEELAGVLFATSVCFDLSVFELFVPLAAGGKVIVAANALELPSLPFAGEVTLVNTVPSAMTELVHGEGFPASVRTVNLAGEPLKGALVDAAYELPGVGRVANLYGPSEDTTYSTWETIPPSPERFGEPLIGRPVANTRVYLLDRAGRLVPEGVPGELFLAGAGLARGYLGRPDLTAERFVPNPFASDQRLYRTGDLARWRPGGRIEYLGRIDHQVKVRGFRIELGEIEAALARHPAVGEAVVLARDDEARGKMLVAFLVRREGMEGADLRPSALRQLLRRSLPEHMVPAAWVELPALPLTSNGKVDRRTLGRLRLDVAAGAPRQGAVAPRTPTEELLAALWCEVLGRDRVGVHDSFFELGGHSLLATRLVSRVRATFGRDLPLARLFEAPTIAELARLLDEARGGVARAAPILPAPRQENLPLSFAQERLWFLDRIQPGSAYSVPLALRLRGTLDPARLGAAFGAIVARHEALRTVFTERDGEPAQQIQPAAPPETWPLPVVDLTEAGQSAVLADAEALRPFDLATGPLLRTTLLRLGAADHVLLLNMHHIVSDGWSLGVLLHELGAFYGGTPERLAELPVQYADFAVWQKDWLRGQELERQMSYWRQQLAGAPAVLDLPIDRPRPLIATTNGARRPVILSPALTAGLAALARRQGATPFMLLLAAWVALLHRISRQADLNVGTPIAGRNRSEIEHLVGFFVNTLVMRTQLIREGAGDPAFPELLAQVRRTALAAYDHQDLPFEKLVDELRPDRDMSHQPLFQVMFALQNAPLGALELPGLTLEPTELGATVAKFDLTLNLMELGGALTGSLEYNTDLFDQATVLRLIGHLGVLLEDIAAHPERPVSELPLLTPGETHQLVVEWAEGEPEPRGRLLHELVERQADLRPEAPAVEHGEIRWSYGELESRANRLAWRLRELGVAPEARVALFVERSAEMLVAMLGVLKAGGAYIPLDPAYPRERLARMIEDSGARVLLTQERLLDLLPAAAPEASVLCLDRDWDEIARRPDRRLASGVIGLNPAYIIYTSGSTGVPKGVVIPHEAVSAYSQACSAVYGSGPGDRNLQFASISFDASVEEIYSSLTRGATLVVRGEVQEGASEFLERCRTQRITLLQLPTPFWNQLVTAMEAESLELPETIRVMFAGGEKMLAQRLVSWWRRMPPGFKLINAYGPTETTVAATLCPIPDTLHVHDGLRDVPIGRPLSYVRAYVLDRDLRPVPIGVAGELCVGGPSLTRGYLHQPALTAEKLIPDPFAHLGGEPGDRLYRTGDLVRLLHDGVLEFIGRTDHQIKLRGYRIELGEIESVLASHPALQEAAVVTRQDASEDVKLVAWAEVKGEVAAPTPAELRVWLEERLPSFMIPATIQILPALPLNAHGKVDRKALERLAPQTKERAAFAAPRNELEATIARVWREIFGLEGDLEGAEDGLGVHDNFFDAGGNSLLLVKLHSRLQKALGRNFPLVEMFKHPTIAALAASLGAEAPAQPSLDKVRARTDTRRDSMRQLQQLREQRRRGR